ncbi:MAG TPA: molybdopterin-synthase adenylyltransferase MoeB, partial [Ignavibacteria bacterium]
MNKDIVENIVETTFTKEELERYSRHIVIPEVGLAGQKKLKEAKVLIIGAGGLGSPISMYLAAAGVGKIGIVDFDTVSLSNLQRQILFSAKDSGLSKAEKAKERLAGINQNIDVVTYNVKLTKDNALDIIKNYDIIADGSDNFATRYLVNDACVILKKPVVYGSILRFDGQVSVFDSENGPCYRCLYPEPALPGEVPSCEQGGVLGVLPGIIGSIQANEVIKYIIGKGELLIGRLLVLDALKMSFREIKINKNLNCPVCGEEPVIKQLIDYEDFCNNTKSNKM